MENLRELLIILSFFIVSICQAQVDDIFRCVRESNIETCLKSNKSTIDPVTAELLTAYISIDQVNTSNENITLPRPITTIDSALYYLIEADYILKSGNANEESAFLYYKNALSLNIGIEIRSEIHRKIGNYLSLASSDTLLNVYYIDNYKAICYDTLDCLWSEFIALKFEVQKARIGERTPRFDLRPWEHILSVSEANQYHNLYLDILCFYASFLVYFPDQLDKSIEINKKGLVVAGMIGEECLQQHEFLLKANIANVKMNQGEYAQALEELRSFDNEVITVQKLDNQAIYYNWIAECYAHLNMPDSAVTYMKIANRAEKSSENSKISKAVRDIDEKYRNDELKNNLLIEGRKRKEQQLYFGIAVFVFLLVLLLGFFILNSYRLKRKILEESFSRSQTESKLKTLTALSSERTRIAGEMHDDLGGGLTTIKFLSQNLHRKIEDDEQKIQLQKIVTHSKNLVNNMSEIIWAMNAGFDTVDNLVAYSRRYAYEYLEDYAIDLSFRSGGDIGDVEISGEKRRNIFLVIKEALHNIVKHSNADIVNIRFDMNGNQLTIRVADNGRGLPDEVRLNANGLKSMRSRIESMGGKITFTNNKGLIVEVLIHL